MTHLAANIATVATHRAPAIVLLMQAPLSGRHSTHHYSRHATRISCFSLTNSLEIWCAGFHYSVIDRDAAIAPAPGFSPAPECSRVPGFADCHLLNDEVPGANLGTATAGVRSQAAYE